MKAARFYGARDIRVVDDIPVPNLSPGQVLVEIEWCGICGSDLHEYLVGMWQPSPPIPRGGDEGSEHTQG
jgi:(R,R)-butanediol dehydrogenase/meso-butanediol dehydrogenase/diacetyl reductase